ncbi:hypothetical protein [Brevundimonas sp.]|uniref:hypothetical protein n=1 Tax=Brevundimonas sp. TaxID=1871086 RepID=UPI0025DE3609|nr:hypothetical protein [Brevundimonas sp.]
MKLASILCGLSLTFAATAASAEVVETRADGFKLESRVQIGTGDRELVWSELVGIGDWWSDSHTYSGDASNISITPEAGGCWCEIWPGGQIEHGRIILAWPERGILRAEAPLGPLQAQAVNAVLTWEIRSRGQGEGLEIVQTFEVNGGTAATAQAAPLVDMVMTEGLDRFRRYMASGDPEGELDDE